MISPVPLCGLTVPWAGWVAISNDSGSLSASKHGGVNWRAVPGLTLMAPVKHSGAVLASGSTVIACVTISLEPLAFSA